MNILVINSGSSSIKYQFFKMPQEEVLAKGLIERVGQRGSGIKDHRAGLKIILERIKGISAVGHRVVHGGEEFKQPSLIDDYVARKIRQTSKLAPLHNPPNLMGIEACKELLAGIPQVAVFDTSFYQTIPTYAYLYGLPYKYYKR
jgi:acetate kinase